MYALDSHLANKYGDLTNLAGRLLMGAVFIPSGLNKLMAVGGFTARMESAGVPIASVLAPLGAAIEFFAGVAVVLGFQTRISALLMIAFTLAASFIGHRYWEFTDPAQQRMQYSAFMKNMGLIGGFLFLFMAGAGKYSLDRWFGQKN